MADHSCKKCNIFVNVGKLSNHILCHVIVFSLNNFFLFFISHKFKNSIKFLTCIS